MLQELLKPLCPDRRLEASKLEIGKVTGELVEARLVVAVVAFFLAANRRASCACRSFCHSPLPHDKAGLHMRGVPE